MQRYDNLLQRLSASNCMASYASSKGPQITKLNQYLCNESGLFVAVTMLIRSKARSKYYKRLTES